LAANYAALAANNAALAAKIALLEFSMETVSYLNLADTNTNLKGFIGGFTDSNFGYLVPYFNGDATTPRHGYVARVSLSDFSTSGVSYLNLADTNTNLRGFMGGFTDGTFGYFVPENNGYHHGYVARVSLSDFSSSGVSYLNLADTSTNLMGFQGGFSDGSFGYLVPYTKNNGGHHGYVARVSLSDFSSSSVSYLNLADINTNLIGFSGGFTDGTFGYFMPHYNGVRHGYIARVSLSDFSSSGVSYINLADTNTNLRGFFGGFTDGSFGYFVPHNNGVAKNGYGARVSLSDFSSSGVTYLNLADTNTNLKGFVGGFTDGTFGYFVPHNNGVAKNGYVARVSLSDFSSSGVTYLNLADTNTNLKGFSGGFTDGTFGYVVPYYNGETNPSGYVARVRVSPHTPGVGWGSSP
jgi:hypothetical protein